MNIDTIEKIANAVLYEGYVLYPYRASAVKNRQRFNFGVLYPREYCDLEGESEAREMQTECLLVESASTSIEVKVRFLQMAERAGWQEGIEREVSAPPLELNRFSASPPFITLYSSPGPRWKGGA